jgi:hypothetical protein
MAQGVGQGKGSTNSSLVSSLISLPGEFLVHSINLVVWVNLVVVDPEEFPQTTVKGPRIRVALREGL